MKNQTVVERQSEREVIATRTINGPPHLVFKAWTEPDLFKRWWVPESIPMKLVSCEMDVRTGGSYRLVFEMDSQTAAFFGKYLEVTPPSRLVWTNEEGGEDAIVITTVTFEERDGQTLLTLHELHPSKAALDEAIASGSMAGIPEQLAQLDELVARRGVLVMRDTRHWQQVYATKGAREVSWYRPHLTRSLDYVCSCKLPASARIVDVGGGASTLVDDLLKDGYQNVAVLDIAAAALGVAQSRLGERSEAVEWIVGDVTSDLLPGDSVEFWHDRAVFHFLTDEESRGAYVAQVARAVKPGGYVLIATFGLDGPEQCSGLPVARYDADGIHAVFGDLLEKIGDTIERHETPWGTAQSFVYCFCRVRSRGSYDPDPRKDANSDANIPTKVATQAPSAT